MKNGLKVIAVVPARGGDPEVPYLNIKKLGAIPLIAHTLEEAKKSHYIDRLIVSTDDDQVERVAREYDAEVVRRPDELAQNISEIREVIRHAVETVENDTRFDIVVTLQATSPFRRAEQIDAAIDELADNDFDAVISLKEERTLTWHRPQGKLEPLFERAGRRDELEPLYHEDGAIRAVRRDVLESSQRLGEKVGHILMDKMSALTVHDIYDFWLAEKLVHLPRVLFCVDGGSEMGMGHVYRSLAVARELTKIVPHTDVCFLMRADLPEGVQHIARAGYPIRVAPVGDVHTDTDVDVIIGVIRDYSPNIIINDRPFLEDDYLGALAGLGASTINLVDSLDDIEKPSKLASIIIATMQEGEVELDDYHAGPAFAILRDSFQNKADQTMATPEEGRKIVVSFGGSDPQNLTMKALSALDGVADVSVTVVLGPAYGYRSELDALVAKLSVKPEILKNVEHMADILFESDVVLCSGGMTVFEIAALGRPGIVLCQNAREWERMEGFARYGTIVHLGLGTDVSEETIQKNAEELVKDRDRRRRMSDAGARLVDAQGASRVYEVMKRASGKSNRGPANGGRWL